MTRRLVALVAVCASCASITQALASHHAVLACAKRPACAAKAIAWQKHERARLTRELRRTRKHLRRIHTPTIREAAFLAGRALGVDPWALLRVGACESHLDPYAANPSGALGWLQFMPKTWAHTPFAAFPRTNVFAEALAAAQIARVEGFAQWTCRP
jgi:soluble lytic murein transglycosylase-like protein